MILFGLIIIAMPVRSGVLILFTHQASVDSRSAQQCINNGKSAVS